MRADEILREAAKTFSEKNAVYKDNYLMVGQIMKDLFPSGINLKTEHDHNRFHILMLLVVKLSRYAIAWEEGGHQDSIRDAAVYAAMLEMIDSQRPENFEGKRVIFKELEHGHVSKDYGGPMIVFKSDSFQYSRWEKREDFELEQK